MQQVRNERLRALRARVCIMHPYGHQFGFFRTPMRSRSYSIGSFTACLSQFQWAEQEYSTGASVAQGVMNS